jgi:hypothetical protein
MRKQIKLNAKDMLMVAALATQRNQKQSRFGSMTYGDKRGSEEAHLIGLAAEVAISKLFNVEVDNRVYANKGDDGTDLVIPNVGIISIKSTTYGDDPYLRAEVKHHNTKTDCYIACYVNKNDISDVWFLGWATADEVTNAPQRKFMRYGPTNYVLKESELRSPDDLILLSKRGQE